MNAYADGGCTSVDSFLLRTIGLEELSISNFMSPNNDGFNDQWILGDEIDLGDCRVRILSSAGQLLIDHHQGSFSWDGTLDGKIVPKGTYFYQLDCNGEQRSGTISVHY